MSVILTRDQVRRIDRLAMERYGIVGLVLMENAGRGTAEVIRRSYGETGRALICCGTGNNGGDGCVIARHLHNAGWSVRLLIAGDESRRSADMAVNVRIVTAMGLAVRATADRKSLVASVQSVSEDAIIVDALLGTGFRGDVRSPLAELIGEINAVSKRAVVAVDVPSGLDCDTGLPANATVRADLTITFAAQKIGFGQARASSYVGRVEVVDIGAPRELLAEVSREGGG